MYMSWCIISCRRVFITVSKWLHLPVDIVIVCGSGEYSPYSSGLLQTTNSTRLAGGNGKDLNGSICIKEVYKAAIASSVIHIYFPENMCMK